MSASTAGPRVQPVDLRIHRPRPSFAIVGALFCGYLAVGLPLPILPLFIHEKLCFSNLAVGSVIGVQFLATVLTRGYAGRITDYHGGKRSALQGAAVCTLGGVFYFIAAEPHLQPPISLGLVIMGRLASGLGESQFVTGCISWSIASVGLHRAGMSMSWTGIAMFGALALGAPAGMALYQASGPEATMTACIVAPLLAAVIASGEKTYSSPGGERQPFYRVVRQIWREGMGLLLQGVGLAGLTTFASLYFAAHIWGHGGLVMTAFGVGFIFVRLVFGNLPDRIGGYRVALWSLAIEAAGQVLVWVASYELIALAGALVTGLGCALIYPALGVETLKRVRPANRGSAMGAFSAFLDIAYGIAGPVSGLVAGRFGYAAVYLLGAVCALFGAALVVGARNAAAA